MSPTTEERILIHATVRKDAELAARALQHARLDACICPTISSVMHELAEGAAAVLTVEEALTTTETAALADYLDHQPTWSDLPVLVLAKPGCASPGIHDAYARLGNLTLLERPVQPTALISAARVALRARLKQYQIRQADQRKDEFLAMLAHELRNPLAPIGAAAQLLGLVAADPARVRQACAIISRQVGHMSSLIDDLLDIARVTRNLIKLVKEPVDVHDVLAEAVEQGTPLIRARNHRLALHLPPGPAVVFGDRKRLVQIVVNLLNNAAKYTPNGGLISVRLEITAHEVVIDVADNGIGMAPELVGRVFDLFSQAERSADRSQGGLGLGLPLVKGLLKLHGGRICARSEGPGKGSTFTVHLPRPDGAMRAGPCAVDEAGQQHAAAQPLRVLVVDDNVDAVDTLSMLLSESGHRTVTAYTAAGAIELSRRVHPHVCLLDIGLVDMDGFELARRLRAEPGLERAVLIAATGYGQDKDKQKSAHAGFDHHFVKPINTSDLLTLLGHIQAA